MIFCAQPLVEIEHFFLFYLIWFSFFGDVFLCLFFPESKLSLYMRTFFTNNFRLPGLNISLKITPHWLSMLQSLTRSAKEV